MKLTTEIRYPKWQDIRDARIKNAELAELRQQLESAREHAAWEAMVQYRIHVSFSGDGTHIRYIAHAVDYGLLEYGDHPIAAVLAVVEAVRQDAAEPPGGHGHDD